MWAELAENVEAQLAENVEEKYLPWWFQPTPLKNDGVRHLGSWQSQYME